MQSRTNSQVRNASSLIVRGKTWPSHGSNQLHRSTRTESSPRPSHWTDAIMVATPPHTAHAKALWYFWRGTIIIIIHDDDDEILLFRFWRWGARTTIPGNWTTVSRRVCLYLASQSKIQMLFTSIHTNEYHHGSQENNVSKGVSSLLWAGFWRRCRMYDKTTHSCLLLLERCIIRNEKMRQICTNTQSVMVLSRIDSKTVVPNDCSVFFGWSLIASQEERVQTNAQKARHGAPIPLLLSSHHTATGRVSSFLSIRCFLSQTLHLLHAGTLGGSCCCCGGFLHSPYPVCISVACMLDTSVSLFYYFILRSRSRVVESVFYCWNRQDLVVLACTRRRHCPITANFPSDASRYSINSPHSSDGYSNTIVKYWIPDLHHLRSKEKERVCSHPLSNRIAESNVRDRFWNASSYKHEKWNDEILTIPSCILERDRYLFLSWASQYAVTDCEVLRFGRTSRRR